MPTVPHPERTIERFLSLLDRSGGPDACWPFIGAKSNGYGSLRVDGRTAFAHRVSYELFVGPIPDGESVLHRCDNRPCCNPIHLFAGTQLANIQDCVAKGRFVPPPRMVGSGHVEAKLTDNDVRAIRALSDQGMFQRDIAARFGVSQTLVSKIVRGVSWRHVA